MDHTAAASGAYICFRSDLVELRPCSTLRGRLARQLLLLTVIINYGLTYAQCVHTLCKCSTASIALKILKKQPTYLYNIVLQLGTMIHIQGDRVEEILKGH